MKTLVSKKEYFGPQDWTLIIFKLLESVLNGSVVYIFSTCSRFWANHVYYFKINIATADLLVGIQAILGFVQNSIPFLTRHMIILKQIKFNEKNHNSSCVFLLALPLKICCVTLFCISRDFYKDSCSDTMAEI